MNGQPNQLQKTRRMVETAAFIALVALLGLTPLGMIPLGSLNVTILCTPVIAGTLLLGLKTGLVLGACFGTISALSAFGIYGTPSALAGAMVSASPVLALVMCYLPRLLVPTTAYLTERVLRRRKTGIAAVTLAGAVGSLTNTVFYLGLMLLFFCLTGLDSAPVLGVIGGTGLIAGAAEAVAAALIVTPVVAALRRQS